MKKWLKAAGIRAAKTAAQAAIGVIGASAILSDVDFMMVISAAVLAAIVSLLTSVAGIPEADNGEPLPVIIKDEKEE